MNCKQGDIVVAKVVSIKPYGAFLKMDNDVVGLLHISEISFEFISPVLES